MLFLKFLISIFNASSQQERNSTLFLPSTFGKFFMQHMQPKKTSKQNKLNQLCLQLSTGKNCVVVYSTIEPPTLLSTLLCTPQYLTNTDPHVT